MNHLPEIRSYCSPNPCWFGRCEYINASAGGGTGYRCVCNTGYSGTHCQSCKYFAQIYKQDKFIGRNTQIHLCASTTLVEMVDLVAQ